MAKRVGGLSRNIRVIGLIVVGLLLLSYATYRVGKIFDVFAKRYTLITLVSDVSGLREGAPVTLAGQRVGQVSGITFIPVEGKRGPNNLIIALDISQDVKDQIRKNSRVFLRAQGLLGEKFVDITPGSTQFAILQESDTIPAESSMDIEMFLARGGAMLDSASRAVSDVQRLAKSIVAGEGTLGQLFQNDQLYRGMLGATTDMRLTLRGLNDPSGTFGRIIHDPALYNRLISAVTRIDSIGNAIMRGNGSFGKMIQSDSLYRGLLTAVMRGDSAAAGLNSFLGGLTTGTGTLQKLATDPRMYDEMLKAIVDLQVVFAEIRADPKKYMPPINVKVF